MYSYISIIASSLAIIGYVPEIYFSIHSYYNPSNKFNNQIVQNVSWTIWAISSILSISYSVLNKEYFFLANYSITLSLNLTTLFVKSVYNHHSSSNNINAIAA